MAAYRLELHDRTGGLAEIRAGVFPRDGAAIEHGESLDHPYEAGVWQGDRLVARVPPRRPPRAS